MRRLVLIRRACWSRSPARSWCSPAPAAAGARKTYEIEFDNAFGLVEGGDLKIGGVKAGTDHRVRARPTSEPYR